MNMFFFHPFPGEEGPCHRRLLLITFVLTVACFSPLQAQQGSDVQMRNQELQTQGQSSLRKFEGQFDGDENEDFSQLLTLKRSKSWYITPFASASGFWTSNPLLASRGAKGGDTVFSETQGLDAGYRFTPDWQIQAGCSYQMTRYDKNPFLDADARSANISTSFQLPANWQLTMGVRGLWLTSPHMGVELYRENNPFASVSQSWSFFDSRLNLVYGYEYDHKFTNPVGFDRDEHTVFTGLSYGWLPELASQLVLRQNTQFYDFRPSTAPVNGRQEWVSSVVLQTVWQPLPWMQLRAFGISSYDNSVNAASDYKVINAGGELRFFWKF